MCLRGYRYSYCPQLEQLTVYMPTLLHEIIAEILRAWLFAQVQAAFAKLRSRVRNGLPEWNSSRSPALKFGEDADGSSYEGHTPDASLWVRKYRYPSLTIKVSYSQRLKDLRKVAEDCMLGSNGVITTVIGIDTKSNSQTSIHVWQFHRDYEEHVCECKEVVDAVCIHLNTQSEASIC